MTDDDGSFVSIVDRSDGIWPGLPRSWSYSSLHEAESCPRQWMLNRSSYPDLWDEWGYPHRPGLPALLGDVVHGALEVVLRALHDGGCSSIEDPAVVPTLRAIGGYTAVVQQGVKRELDRLTANPRAIPRLEAFGIALSQRVPEMRQRVQAMVARTRFGDAAGNAAQPAVVPEGSTTAALAPGFHPEVDLRVPELKLAGRADLITISDDGCSITDYKTGAVDESHASQLQLYALLWSRDQVRNPSALPVSRLTISYPTMDIDVPPPDSTDLDSLSQSTAARIGDLEETLNSRPPIAIPNDEVCHLCDVRHLCDDYWEARSTGVITDGSDWIDFEGTVTSRNGARSWRVSASNDGADLLMRTASQGVPFEVGASIRVLDLHREPVGESALPIATLTGNSEVFLCKDA